MLGWAQELRGASFKYLIRKLILSVAVYVGCSLNFNAFRSVLHELGPLTVPLDFVVRT